MKTKALSFLLCSFCMLFATDGHGLAPVESKGVRDIKQTLHMIEAAEAGSQQLSDSMKALKQHVSNLKECTKEEADGIYASFFRALPKIISQVDAPNPDAFTVLITVQAACLAPKTEVWTEWLASKASYKNILWTWPNTQLRTL